jgi:hypothetical protein
MQLVLGILTLMILGVTPLQRAVTVIKPIVTLSGAEKLRRIKRLERELVGTLPDPGQGETPATPAEASIRNVLAATEKAKSPICWIFSSPAGGGASEMAARSLRSSSPVNTQERAWFIKQAPATQTAAPRIDSRATCSCRTSTPSTSATGGMRKAVDEARVDPTRPAATVMTT